MAKKGLDSYRKSKYNNDDDEQYKALILVRCLTIKNIVTLKKRFEREPGRRMNRRAFRRCLSDIAHMYFSDEEYELLCNKLNFSRNNSEIYWLDILTYLRMELDSEQSNELCKKLELPVTGAPIELKSHHRLPVMKITFIPELQQDRKTNHLYGIYITCSREGVLNYWSIDMELERTVISKSPMLKAQQTWITDLAALPDFNVICLSSTERDLRFYDTSAKKFELRVFITSMEDMVTSMHYIFYDDKSIDSKLTIGTADGKVRLINIRTKDRGPFQSLSKTPLTTVTYDQFAKGCIKTMQITEIPTLHTDWVHQVAYYDFIGCIVSISTCNLQSMLVCNPKALDTSYIFKVYQGFSCFAFAETTPLIATGGPDCLVRIWNPFVTARTISVFRGHHFRIVSITLQDDYKILISLDKNKCVKIWDVAEQSCLQNYFGLPSSLGERTSLCTYYNPVSRQLFVASKKITYFRVYPLLNGEYTDGVSHSKEVSVILFNSLFNVIISCGFDSFIIVWNPWNGTRTKFVSFAHQTSINGEVVPVEITAAAQDPSMQFFITGASDGTIKIWSCSNLGCTRNMSIQKNCEVYSIIWIKYRILVMGENRVVTEFDDGDDIGSSNYKSWMKRHEEDILCASAYLPQSLVTASYSGEIIFWRMETGQSYGIYNVNNPKERIKAQYTKKKEKPKKDDMARLTTARGPAEKRHSGTKKNINSVQVKQSGSTMCSSTTSAKKSDCTRSLANADIRSTLSMRTISVNALICLTGRPAHPQIGTVLAALDNGVIQIWSHHPGGGYITEFVCTHSAKDYVISLCTDSQNLYAFTGHMTGYIKTWYLVNYCVREEDKVHISMPKLRLQFPFLLNDLILGRAKRAHRSNVPLLLNSFKAHLKPVTGLIFINTVQILISCSSDKSVRIWTLNGKYLGTLGTFKPWKRISYIEVPNDEDEYLMPADIRRCASSTTFKVLTGGKFMKKLTSQQQRQQFHTAIDKKKIYGQRVNLDSILGKHFKLLPKGIHHYDIILDTTLHEIPIYSELTLHDPKQIVRPPTPEIAKRVAKQQAAAKKNTS